MRSHHWPGGASKKLPTHLFAIVDSRLVAHHSVRYAICRESLVRGRDREREKKERDKDKDQYIDKEKEPEKEIVK